MDYIFQPAAQIVLAITDDFGTTYLATTIATGDLGEAPTMEQIVNAIDETIEEYAALYEVDPDQIVMMTMEDAIEAGADFGE